MANLRTPLFDWHVAHGGRMVPFAGWDMPVQYSGVLAEHKTVRTAAGLFDISHMGRLSFPGRDVPAFLENVFTNSVATMKLDQVRYGLICNEAGGILDDVLVYRWPYGYSMVVNASNRTKIIAWLETQRKDFDAQVADLTEMTAMIAVQGPKAIELSAGLFDVDIGSLKYYFAAPTLYCRHPCVVSRTGYTGEDGFEVIVPNELAVTLWEELVGRGALPCGLGARDTLRLEAAMPLYGHELSESTDPIQAGLGWAVKLDKGPFLGRDAIQAADPSRPVRVGLALDGKRAAREGSSILVDGKQVGTVTSGSFAPTLDRPIAMGYVPPAYNKPGQEVTIDIRGTATPAQVVALPFYKRAK
jgi:aminomethyltransferase